MANDIRMTSKGYGVVLNSQADRAAFNLGLADMSKGRGPLFRSTPRGLVPTADDDMADNWSVSEREAYMAGFFYDPQ